MWRGQLFARVGRADRWRSSFLRGWGGGLLGHHLSNKLLLASLFFDLLALLLHADPTFSIPPFFPSILRIHLLLLLLVRHQSRVSRFDQSYFAVILLANSSCSPRCTPLISFPLPNPWSTFPCSYRNKRLSITCAKRGGNNNNASFSVRTPSVSPCRRSSQSQSQLLLFFFRLFPYYHHIPGR